MSVETWSSMFPLPSSRSTCRKAGCADSPVVPRPKMEGDQELCAYHLALVKADRLDLCQVNVPTSVRRASHGRE